jgi:hypothetical protein
MYFRGALALIGGIVLIVLIGVAGWQFDWWLTEKNVDRQVQIDNRNTGTQTAWADRAKDLIVEIGTLPEDAPVRVTLTQRACDYIGRLTDPYVTDDLATFQAQEC